MLSGCSLSPPILCAESAELVPVRTKGSYQKRGSPLLASGVEGMRGLNEHLLLPGGRIKNCNNISHQNKKKKSVVTSFQSVDLPSHRLHNLRHKHGVKLLGRSCSWDEAQQTHSY